MPRTTSGAKKLHSLFQLLLGMDDTGIRLVQSVCNKPKQVKTVMQSLVDLSIFPIPTLFSLVLVDKIYRCDERSTEMISKLNFNMIFIEICCSETSILSKFFTSASMPRRLLCMFCASELSKKQRLKSLERKFVSSYRFAKAASRESRWFRT